MAVLLASLLVWLVSSEVFGVSASISTLISLGLGLLVVLGLSTFTQKTISQPLTSVAKTVAHVGSGEGTKPDNSHGWLGGDYLMSISKKIYDLVTLSSEHINEVESRRAYLEHLLKALPLGVFVFDADGNLQFANDKGQSYMDIEYKDTIGMHMDKVLPLSYQSDENIEKWIAINKESKIKNDGFWERVGLVHIDATRNIFDVVAHYNKEDSAGMELVMILHERTEQYMADETELDFVAVAAHELRGPITIIRGYLDVFEDELKGTFTVEQLGLLQKSIIAAEQLSDTVNNILNVARIDQEHMTLHIRESKWEDIITEAYENLKLRSIVHGRELKLELPESLPTIAVDRASILEVINNLVDNAIKYSPEGGEIIVKVSHEGNFISTTVQDFGIGIPKSVVGNLFKKFYRSHRTKQAVTGTGLGLYISKVIVDSHGGNIWVRSTENKGTTFGFELPTYESVADSLKKGEDGGLEIKRSSHGWIKNHSMYRR